MSDVDFLSKILKGYGISVQLVTEEESGETQQFIRLQKGNRAAVVENSQLEKWKGMQLKVAVETILKFVGDGTGDEFLEPGYVMEHVVPVLVNEDYAQIKADVFSTEYVGDIRIILKVLCENFKYAITNSFLEEHLNSFGITKEALFAQAMMNLEDRKFGWENMSFLMNIWLGGEGIDADELPAEAKEGVDKIIIGKGTYACGYGASILLSKKKMEEALKICGTEKIAVIVSSLDDILVSPIKGDLPIPDNGEFIDSMHQSVVLSNRDILPANEFVSEKLYVYDAESGLREW